MNKKITDLAFALSGQCGRLAASGFRVAARRSSRYSISAKAREPKPQQASQRNSRRLRVGRVCSGMLENQVLSYQSQCPSDAWWAAPQNQTHSTYKNAFRLNSAKANSRSGWVFRNS